MIGCSPPAKERPWIIYLAMLVRRDWLASFICRMNASTYAEWSQRRVGARAGDERHPEGSMTIGRATAGGAVDRSAAMADGAGRRYPDGGARHRRAGGWSHVTAAGADCRASARSMCGAIWPKRCVTCAGYRYDDPGFMAVAINFVLIPAGSLLPCWSKTTSAAMHRQAFRLDGVLLGIGVSWAASY